MKSNRKKNSYGNLTLKTLAILIVLIAGFYTIKYFIFINNYEYTNDAQVESYINPVSARAGGYIKKVYFNEHQYISMGDTLVVLDNREYQAQNDIAEANLQAAKSQLIILNATIYSAKTGTSVNKNQISTAESNLWKQKQDIERYKRLLEAEAVTQSDYEQIKTQYEIADNNYKATTNNLKTSFAKIEELEAKRALLEAEISRSEANLNLAEINLSYTIITSPFTGYTGRKTILEGQQVQPGQPLVSIVNEKSKWIIANFKETQVKGMFVGQKADIEIDALPNKIFKGEIAAISAATGSEFSLLPSDNSSGNFVKIIKRIPVKIIFEDNKIEEIKAGMNASISVRMKAKK